MLIPHEPEKLLDLIRESNLIVEGKKDRKALNSLGVENVLEISGSSAENFVKKLEKDKKYVILTDYDREGEKKYKNFCALLQKLKFKLDPKTRRLIKSSFGINKVEELIKFSKIREDDYNGKTSTIDNKILNRSRFYRRWRGRKTRRNWSNIWTN